MNLHKSIPSSGKQPRARDPLTASQQNHAHLNTKGSMEHYERWKQGQMLCVFFCQFSSQKLQGQEHKPSIQPHLPVHSFESACFIGEEVKVQPGEWPNKRYESQTHVCSFLGQLFYLCCFHMCVELSNIILQSEVLLSHMRQTQWSTEYPSGSCQFFPYINTSSVIRDSSPKLTVCPTSCEHLG